MFHPPLRVSGSPRGEVSGLLGTLARASTRPRYAFMMLTLIAEVADAKGNAGPWVQTGQGRVLLRDWLGEMLAQMSERDSKRQALVERVRADLQREGLLPADKRFAERVVEEEVLNRVRASAKTNVSRAVSELVKAGLLRRYYQGFAVDHENRGGQRHVVYSLCGAALIFLGRAQVQATGPRPVQSELPF